jgi:hypothetical protein
MWNLMLISSFKLKIEKNGILMDKNLVYFCMLVEAYCQLSTSDNLVRPLQRLKYTY